MLTVTEAAQRKILAIIATQGKPGDGLRIGIAGRSPGGFTYDLALVEGGEGEPEDTTTDGGGFPIVVDAESAPYMQDVIIDYVEDLQQSGFRIGNPNPLWNDPQTQAIQDLIDAEVNPAVAGHGGHVELVDVHEQKVYIRFHGGCQGCGMANMTLNEGVEHVIRGAFPDIRGIVDVTEHSAGEHPYYPATES